MEKLLNLYRQIIDDKSCPLEISEAGNSDKLSLCIKNHPNPVSITETEFKYLYDYIIKHNYKNGYELATAFGISALAAGLALKQNGGRLISIDSYIEEKYNDAGGYHDKKDIVTNSDGYKTATYLINKFNCNDTVTLKIGRSPDNIEEILSGYLTDDKLDYVFIDAEHRDQAIIQDLTVLLPHISPNATIFAHDIHCFTDKFHEFILATFNKKFETVIDMTLGYNLSKIDLGE